MNNDQCAFCGTTEQDAVIHKGTYREEVVDNLQAIAAGLVACRACAKIHSEGRKSRAANIGRLKDKPITDPAWGRFFESRKQ